VTRRILIIEDTPTIARVQKHIAQKVGYEADILEQHGVVLKGLYNKTLEPQNEFQTQFVQVVTGNLEATNPIERAWIKYLKQTTCKTKFHTLFGRSRIATSTPQSVEYYSESDSL